MLFAVGLVAAGCGDDSGDGGKIDARIGGDGGSQGNDAMVPDGDSGPEGMVDAAGDGMVDAAPDAMPEPLSTWAVSGVAGRAHGVAVDSTGVYVAGEGGPEGWRVEKRSLENGSILWKKEVTDPGTSDAQNIAVDATAIYIIGDDRIEKRSLDDGEFLWSAEGLPVALGVAVDATGLYVVGSEPVDGDSSTEQWRVDKRSLSDGSEMWSAAVDYNVSEGFGDLGAERARAVAVDATGIYIGGHVEDHWQIEKRDLASGALLWEKHDTASAGFGGIALTGGGVFMCGSEPHDPPGGRFRWRAERRGASDGMVAWARSLDPTPGSLGYDDLCFGVAADASSVYLAGLATPDAFNPGDRRWELRAWDVETGSQERWKAAPDFGTDNDVAFQVAVDDRALYVVGGGGGLWRIEKRDKRDGQITPPP